MSLNTPPVLYVVSGPNGSGKTTFTTRLREHVRVPIIDPDAIARGLRPDAPELAAVEAGREAIRQHALYLQQGSSFLVETTLAGAGPLRLMEQARQLGFIVHLIYVCLDSVEGNLHRVAERVLRGGHHVPTDDVRRRYDRSLANLLPAIQRADHVRIFDNSSDQEPEEMLSIVAGRIITQAPVLPQWLTTALGAFLEQRGTVSNSAFRSAGVAPGRYCRECSASQSLP